MIGTSERFSKIINLRFHKFCVSFNHFDELLMLGFAFLMIFGVLNEEGAADLDIN